MYYELLKSGLFAGRVIIANLSGLIIYPHRNCNDDCEHFFPYHFFNVLLQNIVIINLRTPRPCESTSLRNSKYDHRDENYTGTFVCV